MPLERAVGVFLVVLGCVRPFGELMYRAAVADPRFSSSVFPDINTVIMRLMTRLAAVVLVIIGAAILINAPKK